MALFHFRTPPFVIDDSSWKSAAESFTIALTLTLGGYESAIALSLLSWNYQSFIVIVSLFLTTYRQLIFHHFLRTESTLQL